jgi:L-ribulose-5-phosphate 4-epimerase
MLEALKEQVLEANLELQRSGLVPLTWGNVSGIDRQAGFMVIKPSGVPYDELTVENMVVVSLDGHRADGGLSPSTDTPAHLELYRAFPDIGGVTHTHSVHATAFAQACREIPCLGTTHADHFFGPVPVTRVLTAREVDENYEAWTGRVIVERMAGIKPLEMPAALVAYHGPFTWGKTAAASVENSIALEAVAEMALGSLRLNERIDAMPEHILRKHFTRKHGSKAYYGQAGQTGPENSPI